MKGLLAFIGISYLTTFGIMSFLGYANFISKINQQRHPHLIFGYHFFQQRSTTLIEIYYSIQSYYSEEEKKYFVKNIILCYGSLACLILGPIIAGLIFSF